MKVIGFYITDANALQEAELSSEFLKKDKSDRDKVLDAIIKKVEDLKKGIASKTEPDKPLGAATDKDTEESPEKKKKSFFK